MAALKVKNTRITGNKAKIGGGINGPFTDQGGNTIAGIMPPP
jgi:hypothetical protein